MPSRCAQLLSALIVFVPFTASAIEYDVDIDVQSEEEVLELYDSEEISEEQRDTLLELLQNGVDLNTADREELYELPNLTYGDVDALMEYRALVGRIHTPEQLVAAGVFDAETLRKLMPFIVLDPDSQALDLKGSANLRTLFGAADDVLPPMALKLKGWGYQGVRAGVLLMTNRDRLGEVRYDPTLEALTAAPPSYSMRVPKFYLQWTTDDFTVLAGTYTLGFGEELTLSNSTRRRANGFYVDDVFSYPAEAGGRRFCFRDEAMTDPVNCGPAPTPSAFRARDFRVSDRFRGLAGTWSIALGPKGAKLDLSGFGSYQTRSVYQYHLYDRANCEDPRGDSKNCPSPPVYERLDNADFDPRRYSYQTLPDVYDELFGGAHALLSLPSNLRIGLLGWGATPRWRVEGIALDLKANGVRVPFGGPYGAAGAYARYGIGMVNLSAEVTRSFDSSPGNGGGWGALQRTVLSVKKRELEATLRYYDKRFDNPYARPPSGPDTFEGQRARNEAGVRLRYLDRAFSDWSLRGMADFWVLPEESNVAGSAGKANFDGNVRVGFLRYKLLQPEVWLRYRNSGFGSFRGDDGDVDLEDLDVDASCVSIDGSTLQATKCASERYAAGGQLTSAPTRWTTLRLRYNHSLADNGPVDRPWVQDRSVVVEGVVKPLEGLRVRARARFKDEDIRDVIDDPDGKVRGETSLWSTLDVSYWLIAKTLSAGVRYDNYLYMDARPSTERILTNPWHAFRLELEGRY